MTNSSTGGNAVGTEPVSSTVLDSRLALWYSPHAPGALTVELTPAEVGQISAESAAITVQGERMDDANMQLVE